MNPQNPDPFTGELQNAVTAHAYPYTPQGNLEFPREALERPLVDLLVLRDVPQAAVSKLHAGFFDDSHPEMAAGLIRKLTVHRPAPPCVHVPRSSQPARAAGVRRSG
jgi:hypothetical protein